MEYSHECSILHDEVRLSTQGAVYPTGFSCEHKYIVRESVLCGKLGLRHNQLCLPYLAMAHNVEEDLTRSKATA